MKISLKTLLIILGLASVTFAIASVTYALVGDENQSSVADTQIEEEDDNEETESPLEINR